jgi:putative hemolysin
MPDTRRFATVLANQLKETPGMPAAHLSRMPDLEIEDGRYAVRFARTFDEIDAALRLRFSVFNLELGEGLASSFDTGRDEDDYDANCHHLLVTERTSGEVVGTYRLQTSAMAAAGRGFYSAGEFDLKRLPDEVLESAIELGRACIAKPHRNSRVLFLLWRGIAAYAASVGKRYLFGCCSLTSQEPAEGLALLDALERAGHVDPEYVVNPRPGFACEPSSEWTAQVRTPPLFAIYLRYGARVCGRPAIDRLFGTIDYFVLFDVARMDATARAMFFER